MWLQYIESGLNKLSEKIVLLIVFMMSLGALIPAWLNFDIISRDGAFVYIPVADLYLQGKYVEAMSSELPLYPMMLAFFSSISSLDLEMTGRIMSAVFFILSAIGLYCLASSVFKSRIISIISVFLMITNRVLFGVDVDCLKETFVISIAVWANYFMVKWYYEKKLMSLFFSLFLFLLGSITRVTILFFLIAWYLLWIFSKKEKIILRILLTIVPIGLWLSMNLIFSLPNSLRNYCLGYLSIGSESFTYILKYVESLFTSSNPLAMLIGLAGILIWFKKTAYNRLILIVILFSSVIFGMRNYISDRYLLPFIVMLYPVAAYTIMKCLYSSKSVLKFIGVVTIIYSAAQWIDLSIKQPDPRMLAIRHSGQWILKNYGPDLIFTTNQDRIAFYAKGRLPEKDREKINLKEDEDIIVIDVCADNGGIMKQKFDKEGRKSIRNFESIYIYLPENKDKKLNSLG